MQLHIQGGWGRKVLEISESHSYMLKVFFKTGILKEGQLFRRSLGTRHSSGFWVLELFRKIYSRNHLHCGWFVSFSRCRGVWKIISEAATKCGRRVCPSLLLSFGWVSSPRGLLYYIRQCLLYFFHKYFLKITATLLTSFFFGFIYCFQSYFCSLKTPFLKFLISLP